MEISDGNCPSRRSRTRNDGALRRRRDGSGFATPPVRWILDGAKGGAPVTGERSYSRMEGGHVLTVSARKLAAALWHLEARTNSVSPGGGAAAMTWRWRRSRFGRLQFEIDYPLPIPEPAMEGTSKWNYSNNKEPTEAYQFHSFGRHFNSEQVATVSVASALQFELVRARNRVKELETERHFFKKKLKHLLRRLSEEKASWMKGEQQKMNVIVNTLKNELKRERRNYQKLDIINSKLLRDLADARLTARQLLDDYQKERKARDLLEDVCNELVKEIEDCKATVKSMEIECLRIQEEVVEERKMLQTAEVWREERVQMKLADAKLVLEEKYYQMNNLIGHLETRLMSRDATLDMSEMTEATEIQQAIDAMNVLDLNGLRYTPPRSYDIYTIMEDIRSGGANQSQSVPCLRPRPASHSSKIQNTNPQANEFSQISVFGNSSDYIDCDRNSGNVAVSKSVNHAEDEQLSYSFRSSACLNNGTGGDGYISSVVTGPDQNENQEPLNSSTNTISSEQQFKNKGSSLHKIWRSSINSDGVCKATSLDGNQRLSSASDSSKVDISPEKVSGEGALNHHKLVTQWCTPGQRNPHISRAMKGCIEWPRGIQRYGLKSKILEASLESQKMQVHNVLKQRIR